MRLAITGADGVGKTSLCSFFRTRLGFDSFKDNYYKEKFLHNSDYVYHSNHLLMDYIDQTNTKNIVLDRCIWDEYVYGKIFNRPINLDRIQEIDAMMAKLGFTIVIMHKKVRLADELVIADNGEFYILYGDVQKATKCRTIWLQSDDEDCATQALKIL